MRDSAAARARSLPDFRRVDSQQEMGHASGVGAEYLPFCFITSMRLTATFAALL
jgi:hypothetical protein